MSETPPSKRSKRQTPRLAALSAQIRPPRLHVDQGEAERHATWLELFFDLVFVVAIAQLAYLLHDDLSLRGIAIFSALFIPIWWQWIDFSYYADQFDTEDWFSQVVTFAVMFGVIVMALAIPDVTQGNSNRFALAYIALRLIIIALYLWARNRVPESRELAGRYALSFTIALGVWLASLLVPEPARFWLWALALLIEIGNGPLTYATIKQVPQQVSHMDERFGLFGIIVLGEAIIAVTGGVADAAWRAPATVCAIGGFLVATTMWRLYFSRAESSAITQALRSNRLALLRSFVYGYGHVPIFAGVTAAGIGLEAAILSEDGATLNLPERLALAGGVAAFLVGTSVVQWAAPHSLHQRLLSVRLLGALACLGLVALGGVLAPPLLVLVLTAVMVGLVVYEARFNRADGTQPSEQVAPPEPLGVAD